MQKATVIALLFAAVSTSVGAVQLGKGKLLSQRTVDQQDKPGNCQVYLYDEPNFQGHQYPLKAGETDQLGSLQADGEWKEITRSFKVGKNAIFRMCTELGCTGSGPTSKFEIAGEVQVSKMDEAERWNTYAEVECYDDVKNPHVTIYTNPYFSMGYAGIYSEGRYHSAQLAEKNINRDLSSMRVDAGLLVKLYLRDFWAANAEKTDVLEVPGPYVLWNIESLFSRWTDKVLSVEIHRVIDDVVQPIPYDPQNPCVANDPRE
jgi:hypothetical protein